MRRLEFGIVVFLLGMVYLFFATLTLTLSILGINVQGLMFFMDNYLMVIIIGISTGMAIQQIWDK